MNTTLGQLLRYGTVGLASNAFGYLLYLLMTAAGMSPRLAMSLLFAVGVCQTFLFNKRWSFRHGGTRGPAFARYCAAYGLGYLLNLIALALFVDHLGYPHQVVQGLTILGLALMLFLLQKFWVFRQPSPPLSTGPGI